MEVVVFFAVFIWLLFAYWWSTSNIQAVGYSKKLAESMSKNDFFVTTEVDSNSIKLFVYGDFDKVEGEIRYLVTVSAEDVTCELESSNMLGVHHHMRLQDKLPFFIKAVCSATSLQQSAATLKDFKLLEINQSDMIPPLGGCREVLFVVNLYLSEGELTIESHDSSEKLTGCGRAIVHYEHSGYKHNRKVIVKNHLGDDIELEISN
ncbi:hypothetical protein [Flocculibacter collagenilyticus]|uniref:hypothetical protein n=1 Tax=Flocculibacter collagenilyticus TaxID=2744479 RepID=UPI0018F4CEA8|nr:hypothetical protein [Flocculibacter collagenilyticus]